MPTAIGEIVHFYVDNMLKYRVNIL